MLVTLYTLVPMSQPPTAPKSILLRLWQTSDMRRLTSLYLAEVGYGQGCSFQMGRRRGANTLVWPEALTSIDEVQLALAMCLYFRLNADVGGGEADVPT